MLKQLDPLPSNPSATFKQSCFRHGNEKKATETSKEGFIARKKERGRKRERGREKER